LRILVNALSARHGGGQTYLLNLLRYLPDELDFEVVLLAPDSLVIDSIDKKITRIPAPRNVENPLIRAMWEKLYLSRLLERTGAELLFCPGGIIGAAVPAGKKSATMFRNMLPFDKAQGRKFPLGYMRARHWMLKKVMLRSMQKADLVIFVSNYAQQVIQKECVKPLKRSAVIPHGVSAAFRCEATPRAARPAWLPMEKYLLYVSTLDFYKSQVEVVRAYHLLKQRRTTSEKLVLVGKESPQYGCRVRKEIQRFGLVNDVLIQGHVPYSQMPAVYQNAVANIFASQCENCPNILIEAMAAGRPVIVSNRPPMPEFGGQAVLYFDPDSPEDLAARLAQVLEDSAIQTDLSHTAEEWSRRFDWQQSAETTWRELKKLTS
jgi:glycosyltransferase involved in cell wall biosynthesis